MRITEDVRKWAKEHGVSEEEALEEGLKAQSEKFIKGGSELYKDV